MKKILDKAATFIRGLLEPIELIGVLFVFAGIALISLAPNLGEGFMHHAVRDLGIAFLLSVLVTALYEHSFRRLIDFKKFDSMLNTVYGTSVPENVWGTIKDKIAERDVIRKNTVVRLRITYPTEDKEWIRLKIEQSYELRGLRRNEKTVKVVHEVDSDIKPSKHHVPRFLRADINGKSYVVTGTEQGELAAAGIEVKDSELNISTTVSHISQNRPVDLCITREEYRRVPGLYYLVQPEITEGIRVFLDECPDDVAVVLTRFPPQDRGRNELTATSPSRKVSDIFLPGHCLEFKFKRKSVAIAESHDVQPTPLRRIAAAE